MSSSGGLAALSIRPAVAADLPILAELWLAFETWLNRLDAAPVPIDPQKFDAFADLAFGAVPRCDVLLAERDGRALGYLVHYPGVWMDDLAPCLHVADLFVQADAHRQGIGHALMIAARAAAQNIGAKRLFWTVWRDNPQAQNFYRNLGADVFAEEILMQWPVES